MNFIINKWCFLSFSTRYTDDDFPQLFGGPIDMKEYELALHLLENQNIFTVHEVAEMLKGSTEGNLEWVQTILIINFDCNQIE